ncbi:MAG: hypothetical protein AAF989_14630 [Planctomycetota bacterium]
MRTIQLNAVHACERFNHNRKWIYRRQVLGSILVWAHRANATKVIHQPDRDEPLVYVDQNGNNVASEFPQPIEEVRKDLRITLFLDTYDGHPIVRPLRRIWRRRFLLEPKLRLKVPDWNREITTIWCMTLGHMTQGHEVTTIELMTTERLRASSLMPRDDDGRCERFETASDGLLRCPRHSTPPRNSGRS